MQTQTDSIIIGECLDQQSRKKKLFSGHFLSFLNKATIRYKNGRKADFFWLPYTQERCLFVNQWATQAVYIDKAEIQNTHGWQFGDEIKGPVIIKRRELLMPSITIGRVSNEETRRERVGHMMQGFWHLAENPFSEDRKFFAEHPADLVSAKMLFAY